MRHKPYRWHWGSTDGDYAEYCHAERLVTLHPKLRRKNQHDSLWSTLGHELIHQIYRDNGSTPANEKRATRLEEVAGQVLHDFYHRFKKTGLPKCTGNSCRINK